MPFKSLFTDLYELTMAQAYFEAGKTGRAVFSLFVRKLPENRNFFVSCGLEPLLEALSEFRFGDEELKYLFALLVLSLLKKASKRAGCISFPLSTL